MWLPLLPLLLLKTFYILSASYHCKILYIKCLCSLYKTSTVKFVVLLYLVTYQHLYLWWLIDQTRLGILRVTLFHLCIHLFLPEFTSITALTTQHLATHKAANIRSRILKVTCCWTKVGILYQPFGWVAFRLCVCFCARVNCQDTEIFSIRYLFAQVAD